MTAFKSVPDDLTKEWKKQLFIQRAKENMNKSLDDKNHLNVPVPLFQTTVATAVRQRPEGLHPPVGNQLSETSCHSWLDSGTSIQSLRQAQLIDKIRKLEEQVGLTEALIRESQASRQFLRAKLKILEEKVEQKKAKPEPIEDGEVFRLNQLTSYAKETLERLGKLRELQMRERCIQESYNKVEEIMSEYGSPHPSGKLSLTEK